jgi:hypothetical protein
MSWLKKIFGGAPSEAAPPAAAKTLEYKDFLIEAKPYKEGGQFQLAGTISKTIGDQRRTQDFVRADRFTSIDEAADFALVKGRQIIDEQGERLFGPGR